MRGWIVLLFVLLLNGCAGQRARVVVTRANGEPSVSVEFELGVKQGDNTN